jgi:hypothetical protein
MNTAGSENKIWKCCIALSKRKSDMQRNTLLLVPVLLFSCRVGYSRIVFFFRTRLK